MPFIDKSIDCNSCGRNRFKVLENEQVPYMVLKCLNCSLVFVSPLLKNEELTEHYEEHYYAEWIGSQRDKRVYMWSNRLERISRFRSGGKLLDVGCGEGLFLQIAQKHGWCVFGTEISRFAADYTSRQLGSDIYCGALTDGVFKGRDFDVVTVWHVLEHVKDPLNYLVTIRKIIKPDGILVIAVPNVNNLLMQLVYRLYKRRKLKLFSCDAKEVHLYHFSVDTLTAYLEKTGFKVVRAAPDFGTISVPQQIMNTLTAFLYYVAGVKIFNAMEIIAIPTKQDTD